jgi:type I restriction enzyme, S subunit
MNMARVQPVPKQWQTIRLKSAVELKSIRENGSSLSENYVGLDRIESWTGRLLASTSDKAQSEDDESETKGMISHFEAGDILFGKLRPYLAKAHLAKEAGVCTTELLVLKPHEYIDGKFLLNAILTKDFIDHVNAETFGVKMPRADWDTIGNSVILLPPVSKQRQIADYLDRETQKIDSLIAAKKRLLELLAEKRRALITQAVTHGLNTDIPMRDSGINLIGKTPQHWRITYLKRILRQMDYGISESVGAEGKIAVLRMGDIYDGEIDYKKVGFVEEVDPSLMLLPGDLLFNRTNSLDQVGKVGIFRENQNFPVSFASYLVRLRCGKDVLPEFLNYSLNSAPMLKWARSEALPAIGKANLNPNRYSYLPIVIPPLQEQSEILEYLQASATKIYELFSKTQATISLLQERRTSLISAAVTGQLRIPD